MKFVSFIHATSLTCLMCNKYRHVLVCYQLLSTEESNVKRKIGALWPSIHVTNIVMMIARINIPFLQFVHLLQVQGKFSLVYSGAASFLYRGRWGGKPQICSYLKEYYEIVDESHPLSAFFPKHADFFTEMHFYS